MGDLNTLNVFLDADNFLLKSDMKDFPFPTKDRCEPEEDPSEWFTEDALNQVLPLLDKFFSNCDENIENIIGNEQNFDDKFFSKQCSTFPEQSISHEELAIDAKLLKDVLPDNTSFQTYEMQNENISEHGTDSSSSDENYFNAVEYVREEVVEFEEVSVVSSPHSNVSILLSDDSSDANECDHFSKNKIISEHAPEIVKIVYPKHPRDCSDNMDEFPSKKMKLSENLEKQNERRKGKTYTDVNSLHPRLQLTPEETKVALKEGIELPTHYPLTKEQQRQLKRIRRKIRNKISAQHSRRRKQEYVDDLEQKLKRDAEEKVRLLNRIKKLENEKSTLASKVSKLQATLARCSGQMAQPTSCLLVLIMSLALILAPSLKNSSLIDENVGEKDISMFDGQSSSLLNSGRSSSRTLLFSKNSTENLNDAQEEFKMITDLLEKIRFPNSNVLSKYLDLLRMKTNEKDLSWKNKNPSKTRKLEHFEIGKDNPQPLPELMSTLELLQSKFDDSKNETDDIKKRKLVTVNWHVG